MAADPISAPNGPSPTSVNSATVSNAPLTDVERNQLYEHLTTKMGLTENQARNLVNKISPSEARTILGLITGEDTITRDEAIAAWKLSPAEADILFPKGNELGVFSNPFAEAFLNYLILNYALGLDIKRMMSDMLAAQIKLGKEKAEEIFKGAIVQFACAMTAALVTGVTGGVGLYKARSAQQEQKHMTPAEREAADRRAAMDNQWWSPIGASLYTQPITAGGEFGKQWYEREGALTGVDAEEADKLYQQLVSFYQSSTDAAHAAAQGL